MKKKLKKKKNKGLMISSLIMRSLKEMENYIR